MNIENFVKPMDLEMIRQKIDNRQNFEFESSCKENKESVIVRINSMLVKEETAKKIWNGHDYLVCFNENHKGKENGWGGQGRALDSFEMFESWERFKEWFDCRMKSLVGYEVEEYGQISLF